MNRASCEGPQKVGGAPKFPFAPLCGKKENIRSPKASSDAYADKKIRVPPSAYISGLHFQTQSRINLHPGEGCFVYRLAFYSTLEDR
jgi:hypothetical protein